MFFSSGFRRLLSLRLAVVMAVLGLSGCGSGESSANEVFEDYYGALTGTMSASVHRDDFQWKNGTEPFPYLDKAKWTDMKNNLRSCDNEDVARLNGMYDTYKLNLGYKNPQEATDKVAAYWESQGWEVKDITSEKEPDMRQILTVTDTDVNLLYTASSRGEAIEATSQCISEFYHEDSPAEDPKVYSAQK